MTIGKTEPSVIHLLTLFRQISAGEIQIPAFQREFVWKDKQIIDLLESVRYGYPIGSILLWYVEQPMMKVATGSTSAFPKVPERHPVNYVLDVMQRLSSLYGSFYFGSSTRDARFDVWFDLQNESFMFKDEINADRIDYAVPLAALFVPRALLDYQSRLSKLSSSDILIDRLVNLQSAFQDYLVPIVKISGGDINQVVNVFEKINSTGTPLSKVDFMRAITWAHDFDLSKYLDDADSW